MTHRIGEDAAAEQAMLEVFADRLEGVDMDALLARLEIQVVADRAKILDRIKPDGRDMVEEDRRKLFRCRWQQFFQLLSQKLRMLRSFHL